ncbi:hypothetical protein RB2150_18357 [Rhodobacterales bacterium HTCC2150]|nr:hypothetical protein RB2150_18357 [Rhodobacterales bacterium HTCC2150] [Rhodobacteraceae bacterium HTCC2150]
MNKNRAPTRSLACFRVDLKSSEATKMKIIEGGFRDWAIVVNTYFSSQLCRENIVFGASYFWVNGFKTML